MAQKPYIQNNNNTSTTSTTSTLENQNSFNQTIGDIKADPKLFWPLWLDLKKSVFDYCLHRLTHDPDDAKDLCSDTMLKAWEKLPQAKPESKILGWLLQLARNHYFDQLRKKQTQDNYQHTAQTLHISEEDEPFIIIFNQLVMLFIQQTISNTAENYRFIAFDYFIYDKDYKQLSIEHGQSESHIRKLIYRTRKKIIPRIDKFIYN